MIQLNFTIIINNNFAFIHCIHQQHFKINICIFNSDILICNICYQCCLNEECYSEIWILTGTKYINGGFLAVIFGVDKNAVLHASKHTTAKSNAAFTIVSEMTYNVSMGTLNPTIHTHTYTRIHVVG